MIRDLIPAPVRRWVYAVLGALVAVNGVLGVLDGNVVAKIVEVAAVLGFGLAASNVPTRQVVADEAAGAEARDRGESAVRVLAIVALILGIVVLWRMVA